MPEQLVPPTFLFRLAVPCHYQRQLWSGKGVRLGPKYRLPELGALDGKKQFAELRLAWNGKGIAFQLRVAGKSQRPWCRESRVEDSDGLQLCIDTRDTHTIHRASRYCHRFAFTPTGGGAKNQRPLALWLPINRAKEDPKVQSGGLRVASELHADGYSLQGHIPHTALTGYDVDEYPRLGFFYAVIDRELGWQTFSLGTEFPILEDPSLWGTLELAGR